MRIAILIMAVISMPGALAAQQVSLAWDLSIDDARLGPKGGYHIYQSRTSGSYTMPPVVSVPAGTSSVTLDAGGFGRWHWVATAFSAGIESAHSNEVTMEVRPAPPRLTLIARIAQAVRSVITRIAGIFRPGLRTG